MHDELKVRVGAGAEHVDLVVLRDPRAEPPAGTGALDPGDHEVVRRELTERIQRLTRHERADLLIVHGDAAICDDAAGSDPGYFWPPTLDQLADAVAAPSALLSCTNGAAPRPVVVRVEDGSQDLAFIVVADVRDDPSRQALVEVLRALTDDVDAARNLPVYVIGLAPEGVDPGQLRSDLRLSAVVHGGDGIPQVVSAAVLHGGEVTWELGHAAARGGEPEGQPVALVRPPTTRRGVPLPGVARLRLQVVRGELEIAFHYDLGADRDLAPPVQVVRPLISASRVSAAELGLLRAVRKRPDLPQKLSNHIAQTWQEHGYVALCTEAPEVELAAQRYKRYFFLVLLREREGRVELLLSNHRPLATEPLANWSTLLMPAFNDVGGLLRHLRDDVVRQAFEREGDPETLERARTFAAYIDRLVEEAGAAGDVWADQLRELHRFDVRKISPTTGHVTQYEYRFVTLLPLVERRTHANSAVAGIVDWLDGLDTIVPTPDGLPGPREIDAAAIREHGAGVRWDPDTELGGPTTLKKLRASRKVPPGLVWFPWEDVSWRDCPSMEARNADVMTVLEGFLKTLKAKHGDVYPPELQLGKLEPSEDEYVLDEQRDDFATLARLVLGMPFGKGDLKESDRKPYEGCGAEEVWLERRDIGDGGPDAIFVLDKDRRATLGVLLPTQRYVMAAGLTRAAALEGHLAEIGWGAAHIRKGPDATKVRLMPPLIEQAHRDDAFADPGDQTKFLVCDGNHRIVQSLWNKGPGTRIRAVAVCGDLLEPYYARPFGWREWGVTAGNEVPITPARNSKYVTRPVRWSGPEGSPERKHQRAVLTDTLGPPGEWYRRYFRNLDEPPLGPMGGQGGRFTA